MHVIHVTEGLVVGKRSVGESNTLVMILTRELGLVRVAARSARKEVSKLRFGLEPLTIARFSLVRGRHEWKLTGVEGISRSLSATSAARRTQIGKMLRLLLRLIHGEEAVPELYETLLEGFGQVIQVEDPIEAESIEYVLVLRMLAHLGYLPQTSELAPYLCDAVTAPDMVQRVQASRRMLTRTINESLNATGL